MNRPVLEAVEHGQRKEPNKGTVGPRERGVPDQAMKRREGGIGETILLAAFKYLKALSS